MQGNITELKSLASPPEAVKDVLQALFLLLGAVDAGAKKDWKAVQKLLAQAGANSPVTLMTNLDPQTITADRLTRANEYLKPHDKDKIKNVSRAAFEVYVWCTKTIEKAESGGGAK